MFSSMRKSGRELVSVVMPCYNDGAYIEESVDCVFAQTYENIELIIIDDGSDDENTLEVLRRLTDIRIQKIHTDHVGPAAARNAGIQKTEGRYILPLDSDDLIEPTYIEKAVHKLESDARIGVVYCFADLFGEKTGPWLLPQYSIEEMLKDNVVFVTALFYKEDWEAVGGFCETLLHGMEDYDFWLSLLEVGREIYQIPEVLFHYRIKPKSRTTTFQENRENVRGTYRQLHKRHAALYARYAEEYPLLLRDMVIQLIEEREIMERKNLEFEEFLIGLNAANVEIVESNRKLSLHNEALLKTNEELLDMIGIKKQIKRKIREILGIEPRKA